MSIKRKSSKLCLFFLAAVLLVSALVLSGCH